MGRDERRLQAAYATVNRCPHGRLRDFDHGFPDRPRIHRRLLGFEGLQLNSYGAIAATDYLTETAGAIATAMLNLGRVTQDFLTWCTAEFGLPAALGRLGADQQHHAAEAQSGAVRACPRAGEQGTGAGAGNLHLPAQHAVRRHQRRRRRSAAAGIRRHHATPSAPWRCFAGVMGGCEVNTLAWRSAPLRIFLPLPNSPTRWSGAKASVSGKRITWFRPASENCWESRKLFRTGDDPRRWRRSRHCTLAALSGPRGGNCWKHSIRGILSLFAARREDRPPKRFVPLSISRKRTWPKQNDGLQKRPLPSRRIRTESKAPVSDFLRNRNERRSLSRIR